MFVQTKRVYEAASPDDGMRILVDRLWPRGIKKEDLKFDIWAKDWAPSTEARKAFAHKPENFDAFKARYLSELEQRPEAFDLIEDVRAQNPAHITLLYAAKDSVYNHANILKVWLVSHLSD